MTIFFAAGDWREALLASVCPTILVLILVTLRASRSLLAIGFPSVGVSGRGRNASSRRTLKSHSDSHHAGKGHAIFAGNGWQHPAVEQLKLIYCVVRWNSPFFTFPNLDTRDQHRFQDEAHSKATHAILAMNGSGGQEQARRNSPTVAVYCPIHSPNH
jgi:hypothetical protein